MKTVALAVLLAWTPIALAQTSAPPPLPTAPDARSAKPAPAKPRRAIELSPAERAAIDARELKAVKPASVEEALQPKPDDIKIERDDTSNTTRIDQYRTSNRISEVVVTPAGTSRSYSMTNREGRQPLGTTQMSPGLSVPNFFRFEFGRPAPAPLEAPAPPTTSGPAKPSN
ncbi:MAG TPA: hypothetical protein VM937_13140 [Burkholderiaceae bacterium]|jgi:hypothetical protein|nr:hypothetical protein [Burkholderiaceae bacterium]